MTRVEGTNDYSIVSKLSAASQGYIEDEFLSEFVEKPRLRAPLINWGYYIRSKSLEYSFERAVEHYASKIADFQVLSIGAGFDATYFNVVKKYKPDKMKFFEIDLPSNVGRKMKLIMNSGKCKSLISCPEICDTSLTCDTYKLFACDLADTEQLSKCLTKYSFDFELPTLVLSECVITYMKERSSTSLIKFLSTVLHNAAFFVYEQCIPEDGFGAFMVSHFKRIGSPIFGIHKYASTSDQIDRYLDSGWEKCKVYTLSEVFFSLTEEERKRIRKLEQFDEMEEFFLKCSHYFVLVATKGECNVVHGTGSARQIHWEPPQYEEDPIVMQNIADDPRLKRFGHFMCTTSSGIFICGGFGTENNSHKRLGSAIRFKFDEGNIVRIKEFKQKTFERMYSGGVLWKGKLLMFGGRLNPRRSLKDIIEVDLERGECNKSSLDIPEARWRHAMLIVGSYLVVIGGRSENGVCDDVMTLNLECGKVKTKKLPEPLLSCSAVVWGTKVIISGGSLNLDEEEETLLILKLLNDDISIKSFKLNMSPRFGHTSHVVSNHLILVGGVAITGSQGIDIVNLITGEVRRKVLPNFSTSEENTEMLMLHNHTSFVSAKNLVVVGGGGNCFSFGTHINNVWQIDLKLNFPFMF